MSLADKDFHKQDITFDIMKLREACDQILNIKGFDTSLGIPHFAAIPFHAALKICATTRAAKT